MKTSLINTTALLLVLSLQTINAGAAGYLKIGDIKGESTDKHSQPEDPKAVPPTQVKATGDNKTTGLLLPAVQPAREAASNGKKGHIEPTWKIEKGAK